MRSDDVVAMVAAELRQQQDLYRIFQPRPGEHAQVRSAAECEAAVAKAYYWGRALPVAVVDAGGVPRQCLAVYQSCLLESVTRGESFELARGRLWLYSSWEKETAGIELSGPPPDRDAAELATWSQMATAFRRKLGKPQESDPILLDSYWEAILQRVLGEMAHVYQESEPIEFHKAVDHFAHHAVDELGRGLVVALATHLPLEAGWLGRLQWTQGPTVEFLPSRAIQDRLEVAAMRAARRQQGRSFLVR